MDKISEKLAMNPSLLTYGMIGMTTVILAALTVFDSNEDSAGDVKEESSYVSQLFQSPEDQKKETGLLASILPTSSSSDQDGNPFTGGKSKKTRRHKKKHLRKTRHAGRTK